MRAEDVLPLAVYSADEIKAFDALEAAAEDILKGRRAGFEVPPVRFEPSGDDIIVFRLPPKERKTEGGIVLPTFTMDKNEIPDMDDYYKRPTTEIRENKVIVDVGILLAAGNGARDVMRSHGIFLGDYVRFGHYAGREQDAQWFDAIHETDGNLKALLSLKVQDIAGSFDLYWRIHGDEYVDKQTGEKTRTRPVLRRVFVHDGNGNGLTVFKPIVVKE